MKTENKPTGYEYSRKWFAFCLENPAKVNPNHSALFYWLVELNNQLGWAAEFAAPSIFSMAAIGMKSYNTYSKTLKELVEFGFVRVVRPSVNQYTACIIALSNFDGAQYEALEWALNGHRREHLPKQLKGMEQSKEDISKVQTLNNKVQTLNNTNTEPSALDALDEKCLDGLNTNSKVEKLPKEKKQPAAEVSIKLPWLSPEFAAAWQKWKVYKWEQFKFKFRSGTTEIEALNVLEKLSDKNEKKAVEIINHTIGNGWKGFVAPPQEKTKARSNGLKGAYEPKEADYAEASRKNRAELEKAANDGSQRIENEESPF